MAWKVNTARSVMTMIMKSRHDVLVYRTEGSMKFWMV